MVSGDAVRQIVDSGLFTLTEEIAEDGNFRPSKMPQEFHDYFSVDRVIS